MRRAIILWQVLAMGVASMLLYGGGCFGSNGSTSSGGGAETGQRASDARRRYSLDSLLTATISVNGHDLRVWLVHENDQQRPGVVQEGLMYVPPGEIADDQGMLFVFSDERLRGFWMLNTITPLDIAYARADGTIVKTWQMTPQTLQTYPSVEPAMFALEVKQGTFERLGVKPGDRLLIPDEALKANP